jgi:cation diffusion facilitator family transporter
VSDAAGHQDESMRSVLAALAANTAIATAKGVAAALTGSTALLAETLHTIADAGNEVFLWVAVRRSARPADPTHPLGYGPERYYWALLAAIGMFLIGGVVSLWEGVQALLHPPELETFWVGAGVLVIAIVLDGTSRFVARQTLKQQADRQGISVRELVRTSPDPTVTTVFLEDTIDVIGAVLALAALVLHKVTGSALPDALATLAIGGLLAYVAVHLAGRNRRMLANAAVPDGALERVRARLEREPAVTRVHRLEGVYLGPREALVAADVLVDERLSAEELARALTALRAALTAESPQITRLYLTPVAGSPPTEAGLPDAAGEALG